MQQFLVLCNYNFIKIRQKLEHYGEPQIHSYLKQWVSECIVKHKVQFPTRVLMSFYFVSKKITLNTKQKTIALFYYCSYVS